MGALVLTNPEDIQKREFYHAVLITLDAVKDFFGRYGAIARQKAANENNSTRRQELLQMAEKCGMGVGEPAPHFLGSAPTLSFGRQYYPD